MSTAWILYWFTRLDAIEAFLCILIIGALLLGLGLGLVGLMQLSVDEDESGYRLIGHAKKWAYVFLSVGFLSIWVPSQKDVAIIVGGQLAANVVQTPEAKELGNKVLQVLNQELDKRIEQEE
jgi:hypothetical protein